jgi:hypothetical protein
VYRGQPQSCQGDCWRLLAVSAIAIAVAIAVAETEALAVAETEIGFGFGFGFGVAAVESGALLVRLGDRRKFQRL